jgi:hypothetical protein
MVVDGSLVQGALVSLEMKGGVGALHPRSRALVWGRCGRQTRSGLKQRD